MKPPTGGFSLQKLLIHIYKYAMIVTRKGGSRMKTTSDELEREKKNIGNYIKARLVESGQTVKSVVKRMNEIYKDREEHYQTTSNQVNHATFPYWKAVRFAEAMGYEMKWEKIKG